MNNGRGSTWSKKIEINYRENLDITSYKHSVKMEIYMNCYLILDQE